MSQLDDIKGKWMELLPDGRWDSAEAVVRFSDYLDSLEPEEPNPLDRAIERGRGLMSDDLKPGDWVTHAKLGRGQIPAHVEVENDDGVVFVKFDRYPGGRFIALNLLEKATATLHEKLRDKRSIKDNAKGELLDESEAQFAVDVFEAHFDESVQALMAENLPTAATTARVRNLLFHDPSKID